MTRTAARQRARRANPEAQCVLLVDVDDDVVDVARVNDYPLS